MLSSKIVGCGLLVVLCLVGASVAQDELQDELQDMQSPLDEEQESRMEEIMGHLENIESLLDPGNETETDMDTDTEETALELEDPGTKALCKCQKKSCRCCRRVFIRGLFCRKVCLNLQYLWNCNAFLTTLRMGGRVYFSQVIDAKHPHPVCASVRVRRRRKISFCIRMNHLSITKNCVTGCDMFVLRWKCADNRRWVRKLLGGCWRFLKSLDAEASFTRLPNNYYDRRPRKLNEILQQQEEKEEDEEELTSAPEFKDIEADVMEEMKELYKPGKDRGVVKMGNTKN